MNIRIHCQTCIGRIVLTITPTSSDYEIAESDMLDAWMTSNNLPGTLLPEVELCIIGVKNSVFALCHVLQVEKQVGLIEDAIDLTLENLVAMYTVAE